MRRRIGSIVAPLQERGGKSPKRERETEAEAETKQRQRQRERESIGAPLMGSSSQAFVRVYM
eukprot:13056430-Alexandrium_andersonii.AAC.1